MGKYDKRIFCRFLRINWRNRYTYDKTTVLYIINTNRPIS